jgi:uncharacterized membrane protein HdeD (DUF308 family)
MADQAAADLSSGLRRVWWVAILRGVIMIVLGVVMLAHPVDSAVALAWIFGVFLVVDAVVSIVQWWVNRRVAGARWWLLIAVVELVIGALVVVWPHETAKTIFILQAVWLLLMGVLGIIGSITFYRRGDLSWFWPLAFGVVAFLFGLLMIVNPQSVITVVMLVLGLFAFVGGALLLVSGFAMRALAAQVEPKVVEPAPPSRPAAPDAL